jgi:glycosyltransferase involved in cell wall biosynthesis
MEILIMLTYYRPHTSGLTIYAERLARGLVARGHEVTVLTSHTHVERSYPHDTMEDGVRVVRAPVLFRISKGVIMPTIGLLATREVLRHDVVCLHLPQFDAAGVSIRGRLLGKPTTLTYHCDLTLPPGLFNRVANQVVHAANRVSGVFSDRVVAYTEDFASHSPYLRAFRHKIEVIPPPVELLEVGPGAVAAFARMHGVDGSGPVIGMAARLAAEKGVEILLRALPRVLEVYPEARVLYAGQCRDVMGEEAYARRLAPLFRKHEEHWGFLGVLNPLQMAAFYPNLDVVVVPSLNSTETFGLVQVEAMLCGTPSIASDLPGVRQPVLQSGMGEVVPVGDSEALAEAIIKVVGSKEDYVRPREEIAARWNTQRTAAGYEALFERLLEGKRGG